MKGALLLRKCAKEEKTNRRAMTYAYGAMGRVSYKGFQLYLGRGTTSFKRALYRVYNGLNLEDSKMTRMITATYSSYDLNGNFIAFRWGFF